MSMAAKTQQHNVDVQYCWTSVAYMLNIPSKSVCKAVMKIFFCHVSSKRDQGKAKEEADRGQREGVGQQDHQGPAVRLL